MDIEYIDSNTGKVFKQQIDDPDQSFWDFLASFECTEKQLQSKIDSLDISADKKAILSSLNKITFTAGRFVIKIGKKIIDVIFSLLKNFPYLGFGVIFGLVLGALISAIPLIGAALGAIATTITVALGVTLGGLEEYKSGDLRVRIDRFVKDLSPLNS
jgi:hypothetical protein